MNEDPVSRRDFLLLGGTLAGAAALSTGVPVFGQATRRSKVALVGTGIRGTGLWGRRLVEDYSDVVEIVGLCDINPGRLEYARGYIGAAAATFTDFGEMIEKTQPEKVIVTTVDSTHHEFIAEALDRGCDVITEKPMTTDEVRCQTILDADQRADGDVVVSHNYRYSPHRQRMKQILAEGRIGRLTSVDFHWYLDIHHGASYFRRWHGKRRFGGTLFVHKACHHFDLLNWWIDSDPETVYAQGSLEHYGSNNSFRHDRCRGCPHQQRCDYYWDITRDERLVNLYTNHEHHDGYIRDGCVWSEDVDIFDKMGAQIRYMNGVQVSYSCTTYSPYEGYRIAFNGTKGRLEAWVQERQPWPRENYDDLRLTDNFGETQLIQVPHQTGGHGGGDTRMLDRIFRDSAAPDPYRQAAGVRDGALSALIGIAARKSVDSGESIRIADLTSIEPLAQRRSA